MNNATIAFLLEFGLFGAAAIGFGLWQLRSLKKLDEADAKKRAAEAEEVENQSSRPPRHPERQ